MPVNNLHLLDSLLSLERVTESQLSDQTALIRKTWEDAAFSELPHHSLFRYFNHQLEGITAFLDRHSGWNQTVTGCLLQQIDHLQQYYAPYFNWDARAPQAYHRHLTVNLAGTIESVRSRLRAANVDPELSCCLLHWLDESTEQHPAVHYTFRCLKYTESLIGSISSFDFGESGAADNLTLLLSRLNFNHLAFLAYRQSQTRRSAQNLDGLTGGLRFLRQEKAAVAACPQIRETAYDPALPSLKEMLTAWLQEEITLAEMTIKEQSELPPVCRSEKQAVDLSVAHLACLIKLFLEENLLVSRSTKTVFQFFANHFQTKRQTAISAGSLSKEFYSIDQHTAARVRDLLQRMITRINRNFFPVTVAISTAILYGLKTG